MPLVILLAFAILIYTSSCAYYQVKSRDAATFKRSKQYSNPNDYRFYLHSSTSIYTLVDLRFSNGILTGEVRSAEGKIIYYEESQKKRRLSASNLGVLDEVHLYLKDDLQMRDGFQIAINIEELEEIKLISRDAAKTTMAALGSVVGLAALVGIIVLLTKSSCPYVYVHNGGDYQFEGEIYSGAVLHNLERHDYLPLKSIKPLRGHYQVRISNELQECQYINLAELMVVNHPEGTKVLFDEDGVLHSIIKEQSPVEAISSRGNNLRSKILKRDSLRLLFDESAGPANHVELSFKKPEGTKEGKLLLKGKNSLWGDYIYGEFAKKMGNRFNKWVRTQKKMSREERMNRIRKSQFPLAVYLKESDRWNLIRYVHMVGPLGEREIVLPIDLSRHRGDLVEVKLQTGFMFWELDYAILDFSEDMPLKIHKLKPLQVSGIRSHALVNVLMDDDDYCVQKNVGDRIDLTFQEIQVPPGQVQSVFLHCKGYYEHIRHYRGRPDVTELHRFLEPGYFSEFSKNEFDKLMQKGVSAVGGL